MVSISSRRATVAVFFTSAVVGVSSADSKTLAVGPFSPDGKQIAFVSTRQ